jgi:hypothetical protein
MINNTFVLSSMLFSSTYLFSQTLKIVNRNYFNNKSSIFLDMMNIFCLSFSAGIMIDSLGEIFKHTNKIKL